MIAYPSIQDLILTDFKYLDFLNMLIKKDSSLTEKENYPIIDKFIEIIILSGHTIDEFTDEYLYEGIQMYKSKKYNRIISFVYMCYTSLNGKHINEKEKNFILNNINICLNNYELNKEEAIVVSDDFKCFIDSLSNIPNIFTMIEFDIFNDLNISSIRDIFDSLNNNKYISDFILLLHENTSKGSNYFETNTFLKLSKVMSEDTFNTLKVILNNLVPDTDLIFNFLEYWGNSDFSLNEIELFYKKTAQTILLDFNKILKNYMTYLSFLYKETYYEIISNLNNISQNCFDLIVYALSNDKGRFLSLLINNRNMSIDDINKHSILFNKDFYTSYFNLNSLDEKSLLKISNIRSYQIKLNLLEDNRIYTLNEIILLKGTCDRYYSFYHMLNDLDIDKRILIVNQLKKNRLLDDNLWNKKLEEKLSLLAKHLSNKQIYDWLHQDFNHIEDINLEATMKLLLLLDSHGTFISNIRTLAEANFLIQNFDNEKFISDFDNLRNNYLSLDNEASEFLKGLDLDDKFIQDNYESIYQFWLKNGISMVKRYKEHTSLSRKQKTNLALIVKAELLGKLKEIKYYGNDLDKELSFFGISNTCKKEWISDKEYKKDDILIKECDDFFSIFNLGISPVSTCLDYSKGAYAECLLSNFDSNKKLINIFKEGILVGRALLRFTKGIFSNSKVLKQLGCSGLSFTDVSDNSKSNEEELILFLENPYFSKVNEQEKIRCIKCLLKFFKSKASSMNITKAVFSKEYNNYLKACNVENYKTMKCAIYVSVSKSEVQYLVIVFTDMLELQMKENI